MGDKVMKNLETKNVFWDYGELSIDVKGLGKCMGVKLPEKYVRFITKHNGARLNARIFDYIDSAINRPSSNSIAFSNVLKITDDIFSLKKQNEPDESYHYFEDKLVPFGDNGGGDFICFDYRKHDGDNPPIIIWAHDVRDNSKRISFVANDFEEFINMLHEPEDE
jgi:hypothetical protein